MAAFLLGSTTLLASTITNATHLFGHTFVVGILNGSGVVLDAIVFKDIVGDEKVPQALGFSLSLRAPFSLISAPIAGKNDFNQMLAAVADEGARACMEVGADRHIFHVFPIV